MPCPAEASTQELTMNGKCPKTTGSSEVQLSAYTKGHCKSVSQSVSHIYTADPWITGLNSVGPLAREFFSISTVLVLYMYVLFLMI